MEVLKEGVSRDEFSVLEFRQQIESTETYICNEEIPLRQCSWDMLDAWRVTLSSHPDGNRVDWQWLSKDYSLALSKSQ